MIKLILFYFFTFQLIYNNYNLVSALLSPIERHFDNDDFNPAFSNIPTPSFQLVDTRSRSHRKESNNNNDVNSEESDQEASNDEEVEFIKDAPAELKKNYGSKHIPDIDLDDIDINQIRPSFYKSWN